jgi:hypothetical protein
MTQPVLRLLPKLEGLSYHSFPSSLSATDISKLGDRVLDNREKVWTVRGRSAVRRIVKVRRVRLEFLMWRAVRHETNLRLDLTLNLFLHWISRTHYWASIVSNFDAISVQERNTRIFCPRLVICFSDLLVKNICWLFYYLLRICKIKHFPSVPYRYVVYWIVAGQVTESVTAQGRADRLAQPCDTEWQDLRDIAFTQFNFLIQLRRDRHCYLWRQMLERPRERKWPGD